MPAQHSPRNAANLGTMLDEIDRATAPVRQDVQPPSYGGPQRDAINSCVDNIVGDICGKIGELRKTLDEIEKAVLQSAAKSKHTLNEHVAVCVRINDEIVHMGSVIADLAEQSRDA